MYHKLFCRITLVYLLCGYLHTLHGGIENILGNLLENEIVLVKSVLILTPRRVPANLDSTSPYSVLFITVVRMAPTLQENNYYLWAVAQLTHRILSM